MTEEINVKPYLSQMNALSGKWDELTLRESTAFATVMKITRTGRLVKLVMRGKLYRNETFVTELLVRVRSRGVAIDRPEKVAVITLSTTGEESSLITKAQREAAISLVYEVMSDLGANAYGKNIFLGWEQGLPD